MSTTAAAPPQHQHPGLGNWMKSISEEIPVLEPDDSARNADGGSGVESAPAVPQPPTADNKTPAAAPPPKPEVAAKPAEPAKPAEEREENWPRNAADWKKFKEARKVEREEYEKKLQDHAARLKEYEEKLKAPPADAVPPAELEAIRKENEEYSRRLQLLEVTKHPKFEQYFTAKTESAINLAKAIVGTEKADTIASLLKEPDSQWRTQRIEEFMVDMTPLQAARFGDVLNKLSEVEAERTTEIARAHENYEKLQASQKQEMEQRQAHAKKMFESTVAELSGKEGLAAFQTREGDDAWNSAVKERIGVANELFFGGKGATPDRIAKAALHAAAFPAVLEHAAALHAENQKLQEQIKAMTAAQPTVEGEGRTAGAALPGITPSNPKWGLNPQEAMNKWVASLRAAENE